MAVRAWLLGGRDTSHLPRGLLLVVLGACLTACLLNPYGLRLVYFPIEMEAPWIRALGEEWQTAAAKVAELVQPGQPGNEGGLAVVAWALLGLVLVDAVRRWRTVDLIPIAVVGLWGALGLWHVRALADSVRLTSPCIAAAASHWLDRLDGTGRRAQDPSRPWSVWVGMGLVLVLLVLYLATWSQPFSEQGLGWSHFEPRCAVAAVERLGLSGRVLSTHARYWLAYRRYPGVQIPFVWEFVLGRERWQEWEETWRDVDSLQAFLDRYHVDFLVLQNREWTLAAGLERQLDLDRPKRSVLYDGATPD